VCSASDAGAFDDCSLPFDSPSISSGMVPEKGSFVQSHHMRVESDPDVLDKLLSSSFVHLAVRLAALLPGQHMLPATVPDRCKAHGDTMLLAEVLCSLLERGRVVVGEKADDGQLAGCR